MNIIELINSKNFLKLNQFRRRKILEKYILQNKDCKINSSVICFEKENIINERHKFYYKYGRAKKISTLTIGKQYKILDHKEDKIKIENDVGKKLWYTIDRFLYSLKIARKEKLEKLKYMSDGITEARKGSVYFTQNQTKLEEQKEMGMVIYYNTILDNIPLNIIKDYICNKSNDNKSENG